MCPTDHHKPCRDGATSGDGADSGVGNGATCCGGGASGGANSGDGADSGVGNGATCCGGGACNRANSGDGGPGDGTGTGDIAAPCSSGGGVVDGASSDGGGGVLDDRSNSGKGVAGGGGGTSGNASSSGDGAGNGANSDESSDDDDDDDVPLSTIMGLAAAAGSWADGRCAEFVGRAVPCSMRGCIAELRKLCDCRVATTRHRTILSERVARALAAEGLYEAQVIAEVKRRAQFLDLDEFNVLKGDLITFCKLNPKEVSSMFHGLQRTPAGGCGPECVEEHADTLCLVCGNTQSRHFGKHAHVCPGTQVDPLFICLLLVVCCIVRSRLRPWWCLLTLFRN